MNRRFVNLLVDKRRALRPAFKLHRINPASLFYPTGLPPVPADPAAATVARGRLPSAAISFDWPCKRHQTGWMDFMAFKNKIIAVDHQGRTVLYDPASRAVLATSLMRPALQSNNMFVTVGDSLYAMASEAGLPSRRPVWFYALIHGKPPGVFGQEDCYWRSLNLPLFDYADADHRSSDGDEDSSGSDYYSDLDADYYSDDDVRRSGDESSPHPCAISAFTVVGGSRIWVSTVAAGTYSYDTASREWSKVGAWALPFRGRAAYVPEHSLWFGFSDEDGRLCAADLALTPPLQHRLVPQDDPHPPPEVSSLTPTTHLLPLGSGKLCVARLFHETEEDETFLVLTGVEVRHGAGVENLQMIEHKSRRYGFGDADVRLL